MTPDFLVLDTPTSSDSTSTPHVYEHAPSIVQIADPPPPPLRRSTRPTKSTKLPAFTYSIYSGSFASFIANIHHLSEPASYREVVLAPLQQNALVEELTALYQIHTWYLVSLPPGRHTISCHLVYKIKTKSDGSVERYKAILVAEGYSQQYDFDYEETFYPVAKMTTVHTMIVIVSV